MPALAATTSSTWTTTSWWLLGIILLALLCLQPLPGFLVFYVDNLLLDKHYILNFDNMTTLQAKDIYVTWDGDQTTWTDYTRKVRLQYEKTEPHKRKLLAPELASRLTGRAWTVTAELDYAKLSTRSGVKYLLEFLRSRLCQTAVPDAGARLEELLIKLRRPPGMGFAQWSATLLESYRKVQRSLIRARARAKPAKEEKVEPKTERRTASEPHSEPASPGSPGGRARRSPTTSSPAHGRVPGPEEPQQADQPEGGDGHHYDAVPQDDPDGEGDGQDWTSWYNRWTPEQWREWLKETKDKEADEEESDEELRWDELEMEEIEVLPDELLGWLLLRRANLPASARLAVQASVQNSLKYRDIENALRDQEEELLHGDLHRQQAHRHRRTFWVEEDGAWGLLALQDEQQDEAVQEVHWVGKSLPPEVYHPTDKTHIDEGDEEIYWSWEMDGYHGYVQDNYGQWFETDGFGNYWTSEMDDGLTTEQAKELDEAYSAYETKARTFQQSRQYQRAKGQSRGFYPMNKGKKGKGKGKGFYRPQGRGGVSTSSTTSSSMSKASVMKSEEVMAATGNNTGCFICGEKSHGFRDCPRRSGQTSAPHAQRGKGSTSYMVENLNPSSLIFMVADNYVPVTPLQVQHDTAGFGVLDLGATETVGSLEAIEKVLQRRHQLGHLLPGEHDEVRVMPEAKKMFRFGNGQVKQSESYLLLPQHVGAKKVLLGIYTLMAEKVPILIGMRTLTKLGAIVDVTGGWLVLTNVDAKIKIPLQKSAAGHLLVDLTQDWLAQGQPMASSCGRVYMVQPLGDGSDNNPHSEAMQSRSHQGVQGFSLSVMSQSDMLQLLTHDGAVMMNHGDGCHDDQILQLCEDATVLVVDQHGHHQPMHAPSQELRDQVMSSLAHDPLTTGPCHGTEEGIDQGGEATTNGSLRLQQNPVSGSAGSADDGSPLLRTPQGGQAGTRLQVGMQPVCDMGGMRKLPPSDVLHPGVWGDRSHPQSRSSGQGHSPGDLQAAGQRAAGQQPPEEREDLPGRRRGQSTSEAGERAEEEGRVGAKPSHKRLCFGISDSSSQGQGDSDACGEKDEESRGHSRSSPKCCDSGGRSGDGGLDTNPYWLKPCTPSPTRSSPTSLPSSMVAELQLPQGDDWDLNLYEVENPATVPEGSMLSGKQLSEAQRSLLHAAVDDMEQGCNLLMDNLGIEGKRRPFKVMELCCEADSGISTEVEAMGGIGIRCGLHNGCDLQKEAGVQKVLQLLEKEKPDLLWVSFPCGPTSAIQELNMLTEEGRERIRKKVLKSKKLVGNGIRVMERQVQLGGEVFKNGLPTTGPGASRASEPSGTASTRSRQSLKLA